MRGGGAITGAMSSILSTRVWLKLGGHGPPHAPPTLESVINHLTPSHHKTTQTRASTTDSEAGWLRASTAPGRALPGVRYNAAIITSSSRAQLLPSSSTSSLHTMDHTMDMDMPGHDHGGHDMPAMPHKCSMNMCDSSPELHSSV